MKHLIEKWKTWETTKGTGPLPEGSTFEEITAGFFLDIYDSPEEAMSAIYRHRKIGDGHYLRVWGLLASLSIDVP